MHHRPAFARSYRRACPTSAPLFPPGGLWTAYAPGAHWHYSNTGYDILGKLAEHAGGKPLAQIARGADLRPARHEPLARRDRRRRPARYAQGYEAADQTAPFVRGVPLAPAAWVDVTFGAGSVASTADDMNRFLRALADAAQGRGGLGLAARTGASVHEPAVSSDTPGMTLRQRPDARRHAGRSYLHHTGGMVSFSSSFHVDVASGVGAFASTTLSAFAEYRPRMLTRFAVDALTDALAGRPLPAPPPLDDPAAQSGAYFGRYSGARRELRDAAGSPLTIVANGRSAALQPWGGEIFRTTHPDFRQLQPDVRARPARRSPARAGGRTQFPRRFGGRSCPRPTRRWRKLAGRYVNDSPWWTGDRRRRARRQAVAGDGSAADQDRRQSVASRGTRAGRPSAAASKTRSTAARRRSSSRARSSSGATSNSGVTLTCFRVTTARLRFHNGC